MPPTCTPAAIPVCVQNRGTRGRIGIEGHVRPATMRAHDLLDDVLVSWPGFVLTGTTSGTAPGTLTREVARSVAVDTGTTRRNHVGRRAGIFYARRISCRYKIDYAFVAKVPIILRFAREFAGPAAAIRDFTAPSCCYQFAGFFSVLSISWLLAHEPAHSTT